MFHRICNAKTSREHLFVYVNKISIIKTIYKHNLLYILYDIVVKYPPHSGVEGNLSIFPPEKAYLQQLPRKVTSNRAIKAVTCSPYTDGNEDKRNESYAPN
ncbi:hypothetical protein EDEG_01954 [Edhazardia aedis USNM 41457]|uniref:Uncharacterized protein n=1 Tax=Edhazardia aedis (strain USNM 41457) TaxID=1003232 RepID=J9D8B7_EDHAE|nr:hypothetical protein EDEG_01954 [Edhazardia aedis USNM 41457]|eukprot:EJW03759.1 hypothetical protein EDEG_01954 [Edhazardia aedis USNM 41457]